MDPLQTKATFIPSEALLSCHLVTFEQDSNFILFTVFVYAALQEMRRYASCSKPLYGDGLEIDKTIKAKWRESNGRAGVLRIPAQCLKLEFCQWATFAAAKTIYKYRAGMFMSWGSYRIWNQISHSWTIHLQQLGPPEYPKVQKRRQGRYEEEEKKSSREETDFCSQDSECSLPIYSRSSSISATGRYSSTGSFVMHLGKINLLCTYSSISQISFSQFFSISWGTI